MTRLQYSSFASRAAAAAESPLDTAARGYPSARFLLKLADGENTPRGGREKNWTDCLTEDPKAFRAVTSTGDGLEHLESRLANGLSLLERLARGRGTGG